MLQSRTGRRHAPTQAPEDRAAPTRLERAAQRSDMPTRRVTNQLHLYLEPRTSACRHGTCRSPSQAWHSIHVRRLLVSDSGVLGGTSSARSLAHLPSQHPRLLRHQIYLRLLSVGSFRLRSRNRVTKQRRSSSSTLSAAVTTFMAPSSECP